MCLCVTSSLLRDNAVKHHSSFAETACERKPIGHAVPALICFAEFPALGSELRTLLRTLKLTAPDIPPGKCMLLHYSCIVCALRCQT